MSEFLQSYGFFILIAALMPLCHLGHGGHGGDDDKDEERPKGPDAGRHRH